MSILKVIRIFAQMKDNENIFKFVEGVVCCFYKLELDVLTAKTNLKKPSTARGFLFYALHYIFNISISKIAKKYNRKDRGVKALISKTKFLVERGFSYKEIKTILDSTKKREAF